MPLYNNTASASVNHTQIQNIGTNSHTTLDTHVSSLPTTVTAIHGIKMGTVTMSAGLATVSLSSVTANSLIWATSQVGGVSIGSIAVLVLTASTGFTLLSTNLLQSGSVGWICIG